MPNNNLKNIKEIKDNSLESYVEKKIKQKEEVLEGIVLSSKKYKERGAIIHLLTQKGIVSVFGTSYKSPKSKYHVLNNLFLKVKIQGTLNSNNIFKIKDMNIITYEYVNFFNLKESQILFKIINILKKNENNNIQIYEMFDSILSNLKNRENQEIYLYFIICQVLKQNSVKLDFTKCIRCGTISSIKTLSIIDGGLICQNCYENQSIINVEEIKNIKVLFLHTSKNLHSVQRVNISVMVKQELENLLNESLGIYIT